MRFMIDMRSMRLTLRVLIYLAVALIVTGCGTGYRRDGSQVVFVTLDEGRGKVDHPIEGADPTSFVVLEDGYAKDKWRVYFEGKPFWNGERFWDQPSSFIVLSGGYAKDRSHVYHRGKPLQADVSTFRVAKGGNWAKDKDDIYIGVNALHVCDAETFEWLDSFWHRDAKCVYRANLLHGEIRIPDADPKTFKVVGFWFGKDINHVFTSDGAILVGADPKSFTEGNKAGSGQDSTHCFQHDRIGPCDK